VEHEGGGRQGAFNHGAAVAVYVGVSFRRRYHAAHDGSDGAALVHRGLGLHECGAAGRRLTAGDVSRRQRGRVRMMPSVRALIAAPFRFVGRRFSPYHTCVTIGGAQVQNPHSSSASAIRRSCCGERWLRSRARSASQYGYNLVLGTALARCGSEVQAPYPPLFTSRSTAFGCNFTHA